MDKCSPLYRLKEHPWDSGINSTPPLHSIPNHVSLPFLLKDVTLSIALYVSLKVSLCDIYLKVIVFSNVFNILHLSVCFNNFFKYFFLAQFTFLNTVFVLFKSLFSILYQCFHLHLFSVITVQPLGNFQIFSFNHSVTLKNLVSLLTLFFL